MPHGQAFVSTDCALLRTWVVSAPEIIRKKLKKEDSLCKLGVILRGQVYVYRADASRVDAVNKFYNTTFKAGPPATSKLCKYHSFRFSMDYSHWMKLNAYITLLQVDGNGGVTLSWGKFGLTCAWKWARILGGWDKFDWSCWQLSQYQPQQRSSIGNRCVDFNTVSWDACMHAWTCGK